MHFYGHYVDLYKNLNNVASYNDNNNVNVFYYKNDFV